MGQTLLPKKYEGPMRSLCDVFVLVKSTFYRAVLRRARYCYGKSSVCLSVCLSVCPKCWRIVITWLEIFNN